MLGTIERLCKVSAALAGVALVAIAVIILAQIATRMFGVSIPSSDDFAAWAMAAALFLALPYAFYNGAHIRVTLGIERMSQSSQSLLYHIGNAIGLAVMTVLAVYTAYYVYESYALGDTSQGVLAVPLWIPQLSMVVGMVLSLPVLLHLTITGQAACATRENAHDA
ncbi:hypothetical protein A8A54_19075 [Brucella pseudogrignonensis]|uniref:TRAP transporter small permease n=1 Tax=Brucella pseudogrignonensis TaxID=419475 RepID=UPI0007DA7BE0|nr:TRAP transporter small permease [Brucella pseudogrignonensis]ANG98712.1 hypothetical protein A8A54_19075 [Brucella pseudogrignonensis]